MCPREVPQRPPSLPLLYVSIHTTLPPPLQVVRCQYDSAGQPLQPRQVWKAIARCSDLGPLDYIMTPWLGHEPATPVCMTEDVVTKVVTAQPCDYRLAQVREGR